MRTALLTISVSRRAGGLFNSARRLAQELSQSAGIETEVLSLRDKFTDEDLPEWKPLTPRVFPKIGPASFGYAPGLGRALAAIDPDIVRVDGLWTYPSCACLGWYHRTRRPYLVAPRGMLDEWALNHSRWKKKLAGLLFERKHLRSAACLHALGEAEARSFRAYGLVNPICVIPNGIDLPEPTGTTVPPFARERNVLLYLGRIHPKKGLVNLLQAWKASRRQPDADAWLLAIAGWDQGGHERELEQLCAELGLEDSVEFLGPRFGPDKAACYRDCTAFVLPSFSEGLPMVVLEAWSHGKPVLMTPECNLPEGFAAGAAVPITTRSDEMTERLGQLFAMSQAERETMGQRGLALVKERFVWQKIARQMQAVCAWLLGAGAKPDCVMTLPKSPR